MTSTAPPSTVAYGAAAEPAPPLTPWRPARFAIKHAHHLRRDRSRWKKGDSATLDYRNYLNVNSVNRGNQAIVDAVVAKLHQRQPSLVFVRKNWQWLHEVPRATCMLGICGGGYPFIDKQAQLAERLPDDLGIFRASTAPVAIFGVGINQLLQPGAGRKPQLRPSAAVLLSALLERMGLMSVRDWTTQHTLQQLTAKPVHMVVDPALYLAPPRAAERPGRAGLRIGINFPFHGPASTDHLRHNLLRYVTLLQRLQRTYACSFVYIEHFDTEKLVARLLQDSGLPVTVVVGSPVELVAAYGELDLHLGGMLHYCILSTSAGTPCMGLAYDVKHPSFFEVMGLPDHCVSAVDVDISRVFETVRIALGRLQPLREKILARRPVLEETFDEFVGCALALASASPSFAL